MRSDKKSSGASIYIVFPRRIGETEVRRMDFAELKDLL
jgi:3-dehydroquinate synthetase